MNESQYPFTKSILDSLPPPEKGKRLMHYDTKVPHRNQNNRAAQSNHQ